MTWNKASLVIGALPSLRFACDMGTPHQGPQQSAEERGGRRTHWVAGRRLPRVVRCVTSGDGVRDGSRLRVFMSYHWRFENSV